MTFIKNKNISLRALEKEDLRFLYQIENDISIQEYGSSLMPQSKYVLKSFIDNSDKDIFTTRQIRLVIEHNQSCKAVGLIDLFSFDPHHKRAEVGIVVNKEDQRKGYAHEAVESLCHYAFDMLMMKQLYCYVSTDNKASLRLFQNANFEQCGLLKQWLRKKNSYCDVIMLQRLTKNT